MKRLISLVLSSLVAGILLCYPLVCLAEPYVLEEGTRLRLISLEELSSATAKEGEKVTLQVADDVLASDKRTVLIAKATLAHAKVLRASKRSSLGRKGELILFVDETHAVDGTRVPLRLVVSRSGRSRVASTMAMSTLAGMVFFPGHLLALRKGKDAQVYAGSSLYAYTDSRVYINEP